MATAPRTPLDPLTKRHTTRPTPAPPPRPTDRLYVVQLASDRRHCHGQVEHVISGQRQAFADVAELLQALDLQAARR